MQKVEIEAVGLQAAQARFAGTLDAAAAGVLGIDLAHQEDLVANAGEGFAKERFGGAVAVHLRRVDQSHAEIDAGANGGDLFLVAAGVFAHAPGALTKSWNG